MIFCLRSIPILLLARGLAAAAFMPSTGSKLYKALSHRPIFSLERSNLKSRNFAPQQRLSVSIMSSTDTEGAIAGGESNTTSEQTFTAYVVNLSYSAFNYFPMILY
jgi:hypothetical protein